MADQVYTREQRIAAMQAAGWPAEAIPIGVAVSLAESWSGNGINNNPPIEYSVGPWQINLLAHPDVSETQAQDLNWSTAYALKLYQAHGFQPWGAFTNGSYLKYFDGSSSVSGPAPVLSAGDAPSSGGSGTNNAAVLPKSDTTNAVEKSVTNFDFPKIDLGPIKGVDTSPLFKLAISIGALFLLFLGIKLVAE